ncbi:hypothetical protein B0H11DRAFT_2267894, partial [Mycena galericulata]
MFQPFENVTDFYPGLIVWCDPNCYETDGSTLVPGMSYDRKKSRELRPCLVISVDYNNQTFQAARLSASTPSDTARWSKIDSPPPITWKLNDAWIWVATPPTVAMVFDNAKIMHRESALLDGAARISTPTSPGSQRTETRTIAHTLSQPPTSKIISSTARRTSIARCALRMLDIALQVPTIQVIVQIPLITPRLPPFNHYCHPPDIRSKSSKHRTHTTTKHRKASSRVPPRSVPLRLSLLSFRRGLQKRVRARPAGGETPKLAGSGTPAAASCRPPVPIST